MKPKKFYTVTFRIERVSYADKIIEATSKEEAIRLAANSGITIGRVDERDAFASYVLCRDSVEELP